MGFQYGLSGMNAASKNLDVIGHNIANANTTGFKGSRTEFAELFGSAVGASGSNTVGQGVGVSGVTRQFGQGNVSITGNNLDVAINGTGFLQLAMPDNSMAYTRAGSLQINKDGKLVNQQGAQVLGFPTDPTTRNVTSRTVSPITVPIDEGIVGKKTETLTVKLNLDGSAAGYNLTNNDPPYTTYSSSLNIFNSQGEKIPVNFYFTKVAPSIDEETGEVLQSNENTWNVYHQVGGVPKEFVLNPPPPPLTDPVTPPTSPTETLAVFKFDNNGKLLSSPKFEIEAYEADIDNPAAGKGTFKVAINFEGTSQRASRFSVSQLNQDGYAAGDLNGVSIEPDGTILARYSNGKELSQGKLALVKFNNAQGLASTTGGNFIETGDSGKPVVGEPNTANFGSLQAGALEDSNVDLTAELVNMMTAQRSYQANAQTLKTQDQVMSTLVNLR
jgi:flagellar hook protein FlgE